MTYSVNLDEINGKFRPFSHLNQGCESLHPASSLSVFGRVGGLEFSVSLYSVQVCSDNLATLAHAQGQVSLIRNIVTILIGFRLKTHLIFICYYISNGKRF